MTTPAVTTSVGDNATVTTKYWHRTEDGKIQCDLCPRECRLKEGQRGLCFIRARQGDQIVLTSYGRSTGFCVDPIEKKPLNHFYPGTPVLSFGTAGCNLACKFCQNWDISKSREIELLSARAMPDQIAAKASSLGCRSVAYTYNDPVIFLEYAVDTAVECRKHGINNVAVTAGYISPGAREDFFSVMDAANVDLKAFTDKFYHELTGGHLQPVLDTLEYLVHDTDVWVEITTLLIPQHNDSDAEIAELAKWVHDHLGPDVPVHFTAFHPDWKMRDIPATPPVTLTRARTIALDKGLHYVYTGNVHDREGNSTWCPRCHALLVERDWYELGQWGLDAEGRCAACGTAIAGRFDPEPGTWGGRRQPVSMG